VHLHAVCIPAAEACRMDIIAVAVGIAAFLLLLALIEGLDRV
jgi:hypothetical protein